MKLSKFWILLLIVILISCNKDDEPPIDYGEIWDCHKEISWDSITINNTLIGEWEWEYIECYSNPESGNNDYYKGLFIEFKSDNTLDIKQDGELTQSATWEVFDRNGTEFSISVDPFVDQISGLILFCDERVEFNNSRLDGCDNYFKQR